MGRAILSDAVGECGLEPLHTHGEIALRGLDGGVKVILHDDIGMQQPSATLACRSEAFHESCFGRFTGEEFLAVMASIEHMVDRSRVGQTKFARHELHTERFIQDIKKNSNVWPLGFGLVGYIAASVSEWRRFQNDHGLHW
jgi:hypothetical protein